MVDKIKGHENLSEKQLAEINDLKEYEAELVDVLDRLDQGSTGGNQRRWLALARTHIETGFMFAVKALTNGRGV